MIVEPNVKPTYAWGPYAPSVTGANSTTDGLSNTNTLYSLGSRYTAAYVAKSLSTGGYNTWYLPAKNELLTLYSNKSATPFSLTSSALSSFPMNSSTESTGSYALGLSNTGVSTAYGKSSPLYWRAVRRTNV